MITVSKGNYSTLLQFLKQDISFNSSEAKYTKLLNYHKNHMVNHNNLTAHEYCRKNG
jgi:hypothetical protein